MRLSKLFLLFALLPLLFFSCQDDEGAGGDACTSDFPQKAMFENVADNLIIPQLKDFQVSLNELQVTTEAFLDNPDVQTYLEYLPAMETTWTKWQTVAQYSFGPADDVFLRNSLNNFPLNEEEMTAKVLAEDFDFSSPDAFDKGFPALDYLLNGVNGMFASQIEDFYKNDENAGKYKAYAKAVLADMKTRTDEVVGKWESGYRETFVNNTGTAAGTSLSLIVNGLNHNYELIKREKLGVPSGALTLNIAQPDNVEARYSRISNELTLAALEASQAFYLGGSGLGLDDYLQEVEAKKGTENLDDVIKNQFAAAINAVQSIERTLQEEVIEDQENVLNAYREVTQNIINIKTDLPSVLCVSITYIDNPSDSD